MLRARGKPQFPSEVARSNCRELRPRHSGSPDRPTASFAVNGNLTKERSAAAFLDDVAFLISRLSTPAERPAQWQDERALSLSLSPILAQPLLTHPSPVPFPQEGRRQFNCKKSLNPGGHGNTLLVLAGQKPLYSLLCVILHKNHFLLLYFSSLGPQSHEIRKK